MIRAFCSLVILASGLPVTSAIEVRHGSDTGKVSHIVSLLQQISKKLAVEREKENLVYGEIKRYCHGTAGAGFDAEDADDVDDGAAESEQHELESSDDGVAQLKSDESTDSASDEDDSSTDADNDSVDGDQASEDEDDSADTEAGSQHSQVSKKGGVHSIVDAKVPIKTTIHNQSQGSSVHMRGQAQQEDLDLQSSLGVRSARKVNVKAHPQTHITALKAVEVPHTKPVQSAKQEPKVDTKQQQPWWATAAAKQSITKFTAEAEVVDSEELSNELAKMNSLIAPAGGQVESNSTADPKVVAVESDLIADLETHEAASVKVDVPKVVAKQPPHRKSLLAAKQVPKVSAKHNVAHASPLVAKPAPSSVAKPAHPSVAKPAHSSVAKPAHPSAAKPTPSSVAKPAAASVVKVAANTVAKPAASAVVKPTASAVAQPLPKTQLVHRASSSVAKLARTGPRGVQSVPVVKPSLKKHKQKPMPVNNAVAVQAKPAAQSKPAAPKQAVPVVKRPLPELPRAPLRQAEQESAAVESLANVVEAAVDTGDQSMTSADVVQPVPVAQTDENLESTLVNDEPLASAVLMGTEDVDRLTAPLVTVAVPQKVPAKKVPDPETAAVQSEFAETTSEIARFEKELAPPAPVPELESPAAILKQLDPAIFASAATAAKQREDNDMNVAAISEANDLSDLGGAIPSSDQQALQLDNTYETESASSESIDSGNLLTAALNSPPAFLQKTKHKHQHRLTLHAKAKADLNAAWHALKDVAKDTESALSLMDLLRHTEEADTAPASSARSKGQCALLMKKFEHRQLVRAKREAELEKRSQELQQALHPSHAGKKTEHLRRHH